MIWNVILVISGVLWMGYHIHNRYRATPATHAEAPPAWVQLAEIVFFLLVLIQSAQSLGIEFVLVALTALSGFVWGAYRLYLYFKKRPYQIKTLPYWAEMGRSFFPILFVVLMLRSFWIEPFRIPSGSLLPTLQIGDFVLVNKYQYGIRLPLTHHKIYPMSDPKVGDIMVFRAVDDPSINLIKRVVGVPGDHLSYINKTLYRNGKAVPQSFVREEEIPNLFGEMTRVLQKTEELNNHPHAIYVDPRAPALDIPEVIVPAGHYYAMGDNRDDSKDSRFWGFVPDENIIGKANYIVFSWNSLASWGMDKIRWNRITQKII